MMDNPKPPTYDSTASYPPPQGAYPPPPQGAYPPPTEGAYPPPSQGAYSPPQQGAYPPPQQGAYPPPQQGAYPSRLDSPPQGAYPPPQQYSYPPPDTKEPPAYDDVEFHGADKDTAGIINFDNNSIRLAFIRKVFAILILQMAVTMIFMAWFLFHEPTKKFVKEHVGLYIAGYVVFLVLYFVLACCTSVARKHPINLVLLGLFTISLSYMVAVISTYHDTTIVLALFGMTLLISIGIIGFASQTKYDFTKLAGVLFVCAFGLFIFGLFAAVLVPTGKMRAVSVVYAGLGALLFMAFLAFDTQLIMGGRKYEISPEDYVFAAMMLYVDIIYIFLFLLALFGGSN